MTDQRRFAPVPAPAATTLQNSWSPPDGLAFDSSPSERLRALIAMGVTVSQLRSSEVLNCSDATLRNWLDGSTTPREGALLVLDDLRATVVALDAAGIHGSLAVQWLFNRSFTRWIGGQRPIELLIPDPIRLLSAVQDLLYSDAAGAPDVIHLHVQPVPGEDLDTDAATARRRVGPKRRARQTSRQPA